MTSQKELDFDPYELLELEDTCVEQDVVKAYRKKALQWHPDKNPDRKAYAQDMFLKISRALEILADKSARAALDRLRNAKKAAEMRYKHMDAKRRKLKEELEAREALSSTAAEDEAKAAKRLAAEVARLRKEGSTLLQQERENIEKKVRLESKSKLSDFEPSKHAIIKVRWEKDATVTEDSLRLTFIQFGKVKELLKKTNLAIIEYADAESAVEAKRHADNKRIAFSVDLLGSEKLFASQPVGESSSSETTRADQYEADILARMCLAQQKQSELNN